MAIGFVLGAFALVASGAFAAEPQPTTAATPAAANSSVASAAPSSSGAPAADASAAPASSAAAAPSGAAPATDAATMDGPTFKVKLRDLEQRVDELKEQIRRSHMRLSLLSDTILSGAGGGARAEIEFTNDYSGAWRLVEAVFVLDGAVQYKKTDDTGALAAQKKIPIVAGSIPTGDHILQVQIKLRGHGYGVFSYLRGVEATVKDEHAFTVTDGKVLELKVVGWEQGGPTTPLEEQPAIRFTQTIRSMSEVPKTTADSGAATGAAPAASASATTAPTGVNAGASVGGGQ